MTTKKTIARALAAAALSVSGLTLATPAQAAPGEWSVEQSWWLNTKAECLQMQQNYVTRYTRITKPCHRVGPDWTFSWQTML